MAFNGYPFMNGIGEAVFVNDIQREEVAQAAEFVSALHQEQLAEASTKQWVLGKLHYAFGASTRLGEAVHQRACFVPLTFDH